MKIKFLWCIALLCILSSASRAQYKPGASPITIDPVLKLSDLLRQADSYPSIQALKQVAGEAEMNLLLTRQGNLPQIDVQAQNSYGTYQGLAGASFPLPGSYNTTGINSNAAFAINTQVSALLRWDFLQFGKLKNRIAIDKLKISAAEKSQLAGIWRYKYQLTQSFIQLIFYQQMVIWATEEEARVKKLLELSKSLAASGVVAGADSLLTEAIFRKSNGTRKEWQGLANAGYSQLRKWAPGLPEARPNLPLFSSDIKGKYQFSDATHNQAHPLVQVNDPFIAMTIIEKSLVDKTLLPTVSLLAAGQLRGFSPNGESLASAYGLPTQNYLAGIGVTWSFAPFYQKNIRKKRIQYKDRQLVAEKESTALKIQADKEAAIRQLKQIEQQISALNQSLALARQAYYLYEVRYKSGLIDLATLLQVHQSLQETEKDRLIAYYHYWVNLSDYSAATDDFTLLTQTFN